MATVALVTNAEGAHLSGYLDGLKELEAVTRVVLVDPSGVNAGPARETLGDRLAQTYTALPEMLKAEQPVMAIVSVPGSDAPALIAPILQAGVHVMAEKPSCVHADDFARLVDVADRKRVHLMLALANRIAPWVKDARRIVQTGGIGKLYAARAMTLADQTRIQRRLHDPHWSFRKARVGGGYLTWLGIHWLDLVLLISGDKVEEVQAMTAVVGGAPIDVEDLALVNFRFASGAYATLSCGYLLDKSYQMDMTFWGAKGWVRWDMDSGLLQWHSPDVAMNENPDRSFKYTAGGSSGYTPWVRETVRAAMGEIEPPITSAESLTVLRIIHAAYASAASGKSVRL